MLVCYYRFIREQARRMVVYYLGCFWGLFSENEALKWGVTFTIIYVKFMGVI